MLMNKSRTREKKPYSFLKVVPANAFLSILVNISLSLKSLNKELMGSYFANFVFQNNQKIVVVYLDFKEGGWKSLIKGPYNLEN